MAVAGKLHISKVVSRVFQFRHHFSKLNTNCSRTLFTFRRQLFDCRIKQSQFQKFHTAAGPNNKLSEKMSATTLNQSLSPMDPSSFSRPDLAYVKHYNLAVNVNFNSRTLDCTATLNVHLNEGIKELILDTSNLNIRSIAFPDGTDVKYTLDKEVPNFGSKLTLKFPDETVPQQSIIIIKYSTSPKASALQWLDPEQTSGKKYPYLFSQCQPIHARSILPCQDTPAIKFTYEAEVTAPEEYTVLMSALRGDVDKNKTVFKQPVPIPSYLLAIAVGVLESRTLGPRSTVWAESAEIEASQSEFSDTEKYLEAAERLCGRYQWSRYDLLVLPPSFPYGGMENPCLTFVTPTLLAGDKSQADVIIHEIMHSWTGNLVTNKNFEHFWLNEGFTVFLERKVAASLIDDPSEGMRSRDFHSLLGLQELTEAVQTLGESSPLTQLVPNLKGIHPDDAFSRVPYEKGSLFLRYLEDLAGGPMIFDDFIREYIRKFQRDSLDTEQFKSFLMDYFNKNESILNVDWYAWLHTSGMPPVIPSYDKSMTRAVTDLATKLCDESSLHGIFFDDVKHFTPHQMINLLQELIERPPVPLHILHQMGESYRLKVSKNSEIIYRWHRLCIKSGDLESVDDVLQFLNTQGRMKYVRPIYRDLYEWEGPVRERAINNFLENEKYMMHVSAYTLRKDLHLD